MACRGRSVSHSMRSMHGIGMGQYADQGTVRCGEAETRMLGCRRRRRRRQVRSGGRCVGVVGVQIIGQSSIISRCCCSILYTVSVLRNRHMKAFGGFHGSIPGREHASICQERTPVSR